jgi:hypothetical protein
MEFLRRKEVVYGLQDLKHRPQWNSEIFSGYSVSYVAVSKKDQETCFRSEHNARG